MAHWMPLISVRTEQTQWLPTPINKNTSKIRLLIIRQTVLKNIYNKSRRDCIKWFLRRCLWFSNLISCSRSLMDLRPSIPTTGRRTLFTKDTLRILSKLDGSGRLFMDSISSSSKISCIIVQELPESLFWGSSI